MEGVGLGGVGLGLGGRPGVDLMGCVVTTLTIPFGNFNLR